MSLVTRARVKYAVLIVVVVALGLATRPLKRQFPMSADAAGDALWAMMVFLLISVIWPMTTSWRRAGLALAFAFAVEFSQIYHAPWIDQIRRTSVGATALGFTFDWRDLVWYTAGVAAGLFVSRALPIFRGTAAIALVMLIAPGCARQMSADERVGLRIFAENRKQPAERTLTNAQIKSILDDNVGIDAQADAIVVGIVDESGTRVIAAGESADGDTVFRIGSITKVFTAMLLQDMVDRGEMKLDDPVQKFLPASVKMPTRGGRQITLLDLATHTSGLPRDGGWGATVDQFYQWLATCELRHDPGTVKEYSNVGFCLLGHVIALKAGKDYETLLLERICTPLGMTSTRTVVTDELKRRMARAYAFPGRELADAMRPSMLPGAGSIRSTANDLSKLASASLGLTPSPLRGLIRRTQENRLAWLDEGGIIEHGGDVAGFRSDLLMDPSHRRGVVLLANCTQSHIRGIARPLVTARSPRPSRVAAIDPKLLDNYVGEYRRNDSEVIVRRHGDRLLFQWWTGKIGHSLPNVRCEGFAQSNTVFYSQLWADPVIFTCDANGCAKALRIKETVWKRTAITPREFTRPPIDSAHFAVCVGRYRHKLLGLIPVGPTLEIYSTQDELGMHLMARAPEVMGEESTELIPVNESTVISADLPGAWFTFRRDGRGRARGVLVHFNGRDIYAAWISAQPLAAGR